MTTKQLTGDRCKCPACGVYFRSTGAFDCHRIGSWEDRSCLDNLEMLAIGMWPDAEGYWLTPGDTLKYHQSIKRAKIRLIET